MLPKQLSSAIWSAPYWSGYRSQLHQLALQSDSGLPSPGPLNALLPKRARTTSGHPIQFVDSTTLGPVDYEDHIFKTGQVSTRGCNWHDLFNALVWARYPAIKAAVNAQHQSHLGDRGPGGRGRGRVRDALTLFDESGVIVASSNPEWLQLLRRHQWPELFQNNPAAWAGEIRVFIVGHAILEKLLAPYKSMTAHALLVALEGDPEQQPHDREDFEIDTLVAEQISQGQRLTAPRVLSPLPLMGIPGWWPHGAQDGAFYRDQQVFRGASGTGKGLFQITPQHRPPR